MRPAWVGPFLVALANSPSVADAARAAGITRQRAYQYRQDDPEFAAEWEDAHEQAIDSLVGESYRRARHGTEKPVFYKGDECGRIREFSDTLAIFLLKTHRREVYGDRERQPATGDGQTVVHVIRTDRGIEPADAGPGKDQG
jgi:hypothetical protein